MTAGGELSDPNDPRSTTYAHHAKDSRRKVKKQGKQASSERHQYSRHPHGRRESSEEPVERDTSPQDKDDQATSYATLRQPVRHKSNASAAILILICTCSSHTQYSLQEVCSHIQMCGLSGISAGCRLLKCKQQLRMNPRSY